MTSAGTEEKFNKFLFFLTISLVGNSCADFAFIWHAVAQLPQRVGKTGTHISDAGLLPSFYLGQACGLILLAPFISAYADRYTKRTFSLCTDVTYALFLVGILAVNIFGTIRPEVLFFFSLVTATLSGLHRNVVGFGALNLLSAKTDVTHLVSKFNAAYFTVALIGSTIAGVLYRWSGLNICLIIAILTFLPMPYIYFQIFPKIEPRPIIINRDIKRELREGIKFILNDNLLLTNSVCILLWNISANMFPAIIGIAFQRYMPGRTDFASYAVSMAIMVGIISYYPLQKIANQLSVQKLIPYALIFPSTIMAICAFTPGPLLFAMGYSLNCVGSALLNILSSGIRVKRVPNELLGRVNTAHTAIISIGQIIGSVWLLPVMVDSLALGAAVITLNLVLSSAVAYTFMPNTRLGTILS